MGAWLDHAKLRRTFKGGLNSDNSSYSLWKDEVAFLGRLGSLLAKTLHFIQQFMYYMFIEVIEPNWNRMEKKIFSVRYQLFEFQRQRQLTKSLTDMTTF